MRGKLDFHRRREGAVERWQEPKSLGLWIESHGDFGSFDVDVKCWRRRVPLMRACGADFLVRIWREALELSENLYANLQMAVRNDKVNRLAEH